MKSKLKKIIYIVLLSVVILIIGMLVLVRDSAKISEVKGFIKNDLKVLCIEKQNEFDYVDKLLLKYDVDCLNVNIDKLNIIEKQKIKNIIDNKVIDSSIVVYKNGKIYSKYVGSDIDEVKLFFQKNNVIPEEIIEDPGSILQKFYQIFEKDYSIVYIPYIKHEEIKTQDVMLKKLANKYSIEYNKIDAYLLSENQKNKLNALLEISEVENQIILLVKNKKVVANIRGIHSKNTYTEFLYESGFIKELEIKIEEIKPKEFELKVAEKGKNIVLLGLDNCKDCDTVSSLLNQMIYNYNISIKYVNLKNPNSNEYKIVHENLNNIGYTDGFSLPLVIITENNKILNYIIGNSNEKYFLQVFIENGVIKGDVINE